MRSGCCPRGWSEILLTLLLMCSFVSGCPSGCTCASDLLSCTRAALTKVPENLPPTSVTLDLSHNSLHSLHSYWLSAVPHLHVLCLNHNEFKRLPAGAFHNATNLRHLDLSSNKLQSIRAEHFHHLLSLEELLLYNNHISHMEEAAFTRLHNIRKIYLSWNNLSAFSFSSMCNLTHPNLRTLDLSSNKFLELPVDEMSALPAFIKNGLYLHNNPLTCSCTLYTLLSQWKQRGFSSVLDFWQEHTCLYMGKPRAVVRILESQNGLDNCSTGLGQQLGDTGLKVLVGRRVMVTCNTSLPQENTTYLWISPAYNFIFPPGNSNQSFRIHPNGSLEIHKAQPWNSGVYLCIAVNRRLSYNATHEVNVTVHYPKHEVESFNTGLTTLLGCVVSLVLVFIYLYMTPCRCLLCCSKPPQTPSPPQESSAQSSILCVTPPVCEGANSRKVGASRHVVFLEPIKEGRSKKNPKILQLRSDSDSSVFSDCPIVPT
ncbi:amphoterin-induced protein 3 [Bufo gargarizans]|uniref:amphoterin-induced protein 3 n=1 Tax=Bufo gargarizans TaxID=30331 RepID=UPI001CF3B293|nr:amphoterin-induced protein 3 [Bufo gargarizans]